VDYSDAVLADVITGVKEEGIPKASALMWGVLLFMQWMRSPQHAHDHAVRQARKTVVDFGLAEHYVHVSQFF
jgi:hypothetical protein